MSEEAAKCVAHGKKVCSLCTLNPSTCGSGQAGIQVGCGTYASTGMHWDTCPNRVTGIDGNGDWVMANGERVAPKSHRLMGEEDQGVFKDLDPRMFTFIKDMSQDDLIKEIIDDQRSDLKKLEMIKLREMVAAMRVENFKRAVMKEAGLRVHIGPLGFPHIEEDEN